MDYISRWATSFVWVGLYLYKGRISCWAASLDWLDYWIGLICRTAASLDWLHLWISCIFGLAVLHELHLLMGCIFGLTQSLNHLHLWIGCISALAVSLVLLHIWIKCILRRAASMDWPSRVIAYIFDIDNLGLRWPKRMGELCSHISSEQYLKTSLLPSPLFTTLTLLCYLCIYRLHVLFRNCR
jgi:hypothetical protein